MTSEFNAVAVREKYQNFDGQNKVQMPLLLADNRYPMTTTELFGERLQGRGIDRYVDTGDLVAYNGPKGDNQEVKFVLTANRQGLTDIGRFALGLINPQSTYVNGAVNLNQARDASNKEVKNAYDALKGNGVIAVKRKDLGIINERIPVGKILEQRGWRILTRHPDEVPKEFAEDPEKAKEYVQKLVASRYNEAMALCPSDGEKVPTLRAWFVGGLDVFRWSIADGWYYLVFDVGRLVGVAPEAPIALGVGTTASTPQVKNYTVADLQAVDSALRGLESVVKSDLLNPITQLRSKL